MDKMEEHLRSQDNTRTVEVNETNSDKADETDEVQPLSQMESEQASDNNIAMPDLLRKNIQLMAQATSRIA